MHKSNQIPVQTKICLLEASTMHSPARRTTIRPTSWFDIPLVSGYHDQCYSQPVLLNYDKLMDVKTFENNSIMKI